MAGHHWWIVSLDLFQNPSSTDYWLSLICGYLRRPVNRVNRHPILVGFSAHQELTPIPAGRRTPCTWPRQCVVAPGLETLPSSERFQGWSLSATGSNKRYTWFCLKIGCIPKLPCYWKNDDQTPNKKKTCPIFNQTHIDPPTQMFDGHYYNWPAVLGSDMHMC